MTDGHATESSNGGQPFSGYDRLKPRELKKSLASHSQDELEEIERYERANKKRPAILDKLRFMRGRQPLPGYDQLEPTEIAAALEDADTETVKRVRDYERKFANRPEVLEEVVKVHRYKRGRLAPASEVPGTAMQVEAEG